MNRGEPASAGRSASGAVAARSVPPAAPPAAPPVPSLTAFAARSAPPLAAGLLLVLLAAFQADRASAAETAYLALWIVAVLLPVAALAPAPARESTLAATLAAVAVWTLPTGAARSTVVGALLLAALALAAARALGGARTPAAGRALATMEPPGSTPAPGADRPSGRAARELLALTLPLALGAQVLLRGDLLLAPGPAETASLVALPAIGAGALALLAARCGLPAALLAAAAAVTLGPGWTAVTALALAGAAVGAEARLWIERAGEASGLRRWLVGSLPREAQASTSDSGEPSVEGRTTPTGSRLMIGLLLALLAGGLAIETRASAAALAAALVIAVPRSHRRVRMLLLLLAAALPAAAALAPLRSWPDALGQLAWVPIVLPALAWAPALPRQRWAPMAAALGLTAAGVIAVPGPAAPAAGLAALAVLLAGGSRGAPPAASAVQATWSAALLAGTALLASYPWLRPSPAGDALGLAGLSPGWADAAVLAALALAIGFGAGAATRGSHRGRPAAWATAVAIGVAVFAALPPPAHPAFTGPAALGPQRPRLAIELDGSPVGTVDLFSNLSGAAELAAGTEVASVGLLGPEGERLTRWVLRAGEGTGEWAARRPDVAALPALAAPPAWTSWVEAPGGAGDAAGEPFFGQLYRARWTAEPPVPAARLVIERSPTLPPGVGLAVQRVEAAP